MKRQAIKAAVEDHLKAMGFGKGSWEWVRSELVLLVDTNLKRIRLPAGMSQRALIFELGRLQGFAEAIGLPARLNGSGRHASQPALELTPAPA